MAYRVLEHYLTDEGLPHYRGNGTPFGAIGGHSSESPPGEQALWDVLAWMVATAAQRGASYHEFWAWVPEKPDDFLVVKAVEPSWAAGSVGVGSSLALDNWARECLTRSGNANDPNQGIYAVCVIGRSKDIRDVWSKNRKFVAFVHRRLREITAEAKGWQSLPLDRIVEHFRINPTTRTDWGRLPINLTLEQRQASAAVRTQWHSALTDAIGATRSTIPATLPESEEDMPLLRPVRQQWTTGTGNTQATSATATPGGQFFTAGPGVGDPKWFTEATKVWTIAETEDGLWRAVEFGSEVLWMHRNNLRPIDGTRNPATGFGTPTLGVADCSVQEATIETQAQRIADLQTALGGRDAAIVKKNAALDAAIDHEKPHADLSTTLATARKA